MSEDSKTYTAKWMECPLVLAKNIAEAGTISGIEGATAVGAETTITATTNPGYTWLGWYDGETKVSEGASLAYTFTMSAENKTYTAKWMLCPVTLEKNIAEAGTISGVEGATAVGGETTITATTNPGYTWLGWYDGDTKVSEGASLTYTFTMSEDSKTYTAKWEASDYVITLNTNGGECDPLSVEVTYGQSYTLPVPTRQYYTFDGWYYNGTKITNANGVCVSKYNYTRDITVQAQWTGQLFTLTLSKEDSHGTVSGSGSKNYNSEVTITATPHLGYTFVGWYQNGTKVSSQSTYKFKMPANVVQYTARWAIASEMENFEFTSSASTCTITAVKDKTVTSIAVPSYVTYMNDAIFSGCSNLTSLTIPFVGNEYATTRPFGILFGRDSYTNSYAADCYAESVMGTYYYLPKSLTTVIVLGGCIGNYAFQDCRMITNVIIGENVNGIKSRAFNWCDSLTSVTFKDTTTWYRTRSETDWTNKTGGTSTTLTNSSTNATYFTDTYLFYHWYKV